MVVAAVLAHIWVGPVDVREVGASCQDYEECCQCGVQRWQDALHSFLHQPKLTYSLDLVPIRFDLSIMN